MTRKAKSDVNLASVSSRRSDDVALARTLRKFKPSFFVMKKARDEFSHSYIPPFSHS